QVLAVGTDNVNNVSTASAPVPVTVDNSGPSVSITAPASNTVYDGPNNTWATTWSGTLTGTASGGVGLTKVQYAVQKVGGNYWNCTSFSSSSQVLTNASGTTSWTV